MLKTVMVLTFTGAVVGKAFGGDDGAVIGGMVGLVSEVVIEVAKEALK